MKPMTATMTIAIAAGLLGCANAQSEDLSLSGDGGRDPVTQSQTLRVKCPAAEFALVSSQDGHDAQSLDSVTANGVAIPTDQMKKIQSEFAGADSFIVRHPKCWNDVTQLSIVAAYKDPHLNGGHGFKSALVSIFASGGVSIALPQSYDLSEKVQ